MPSPLPQESTPPSGLHFLGFPWADRRCRFFLWVCFLFTTGIAWAIPTIGNMQQHRYRMLLSAAAVVWVCAYAIMRQRCGGSLFGKRRANPMRLPKARWILGLALSCSCIFGAFNYYRFDPDRLTTVSGHADVTYYYLNSKYFDELGYYELYPAMLVADGEHKQRLAHITVFRDLHTYRNVPVRRAFEREPEIRQRFTASRWTAFKLDLDFFLKTGTRGAWAYFLKDHGYNAPPTWTVVGQRLSSLTEVEHLKWITMADFLILAVAFVAIARTFGLDVMLFALLFFVCTASGKWPLLGSSLLRFDWLAALIGSVCALKRGRHGLAGGLLAYATLNRIFPAVFVLPYLIRSGYKFLRTRHLPDRQRRFLCGAVIVSGILVTSALATQGPAAFRTSAENLLLHNSAKSYSSYRVGLGDALLFRGERSRAEIRGGIPAKEEQLEALKPTVQAVGLAVLALLALHIIRTNPQSHTLIALGFFPFFALTTPQINYFNVRLLLIMWHMHDPVRPRNTFGLVCLFAIEALAAFTQINGAIEYTWTSTTSIGLAFYSVVILATLTADGLKKTVAREAPPLPTRIGASLAAAVFGLLCLCGIFAGYWRAQDVGPPTQSVSLRDLKKVREAGSEWNGPGTLRLDPSGIRIDSEERQHGRRLDVSFDNNDRYVVRYLLDDREIARQDLRRSGDSPRGGLARQTLSIPLAARREGFDSIVIVPTGGDGLFSLGHVRILDP
ncbi:MAG: hypothetical protein V3V08_21545 [Nannocystaceae bacterium]